MAKQELLEESKQFQNLLANHYAQAEATSPLQKVRAKAWERYLTLGLPTRRNELYRYVPLKNLFAQSYQASHPTAISIKDLAPHIIPECSRSHLVFVNGHYCPTLSNLTAIPKRIVISSLNDAIGPYGALLNNQWTKALQEEIDSFAVLNTALHRDGAFVYIPPKSEIEVPIQLLHVVDTHNQPMLLQPRLNLFVGAHSQATFVSSQLAFSGSSYCVNQAVDLSIEEGAQINYIQLACEAAPEAWHLDSMRAQLKRSSTLKTVCVTDGSATVRHDYRIALTGEGAEALLNGIWMLSGKREAHTQVLMDHQAPNCRSMQLFKGVLNDFSRSSFEGKIFVRQAAQKTEAFQTNHNLLISDRANADSKPNLEIFADDVKASHGATVGQLDADQLFYMKSRGFGELEAKTLLLFGFCKEVIDLISIPSLQQKVIDHAKSYLYRGAS